MILKTRGIRKTIFGSGQVLLDEEKLFKLGRHLLWYRDDVLSRPSSSVW